MLSWSGSLHAEGGESGNGDTAVQLGHEGLRLYQAGNWEQALARFKTANQTMYSPVFELYMARCLRNLSQLLEAAEELEALLARDAGPDAPLSWQNAVRDGRAELEAIRARIPSLRISKAGVTAATVDGLPVSAGDLVRLNPGEHVVRGYSLDGQFDERRLSLSEGQQDVAVILHFVPTKSAALGAPTQPARPLPPRPAESRRTDKSWQTAAWMTGGMALASAVVGTVTGLMARSEVKSIRARCEGSQCPPELQGASEHARQLANVSTVAFGIAGVDLGFSVTFLLLSPGSSAP